MSRLKSSLLITYLSLAMVSSLVQILDTEMRSEDEDDGQSVDAAVVRILLDAAGVDLEMN